jgi:hypothetical protein
MERPPPAAQVLKTLRIVVGVLMLGLLITTLMMALMTQTGRTQPQPQSGSELMLLVVAGAWVVAAGTSFAMRGMFVSQARARWDGARGDNPEEALAPVFMASTIARAAMIEGAGLFGAIAFFVYGQTLALLAPLLSLGLMGLMFPANDKFRAFVHEVTGKI